MLDEIDEMEYMNGCLDQFENNMHKNINEIIEASQKYRKKELISVSILSAIVGIAICFFALAVLSCSSFKPTYQPIDDECAIYYDTMRYYAATTKEDAAIVGQWSEFCKDRIKERRREENKK